MVINFDSWPFFVDIHEHFAQSNKYILDIGYQLVKKQITLTLITLNLAFP